MPTYSFRCVKCGQLLTHCSSIRDYVNDRPTFVHCAEPMERYFEVVPALALHNALASDRHYEGMRATDGTDIGSRAKHREYMRRNNLTTVDDFKETWAKSARERTERLSGADPTRAHDVAAAIEKLGG